MYAKYAALFFFCWNKVILSLFDNAMSIYDGKIHLQIRSL